jgi:hypothetical protein
VVCTVKLYDFLKVKKALRKSVVASRSAQFAILLRIMWMKFVLQINAIDMNVTSYFTHSIQGTLYSSKPVPVATRSKRWVCGFGSCWGHRSPSLEIIVCYYVEVSMSGWSLIQRIPTEFGVSECDHEASITRRPWLIRACCATLDGGRESVGQVNNIKMNSRISQWFMKHIQTWYTLTSYNKTNNPTLHGNGGLITSARWYYCLHGLNQLTN